MPVAVCEQPTPSRPEALFSAGVKRRVVFDTLPSSVRSFQVFRNITNVGSPAHIGGPATLTSSIAKYTNNDTSPTKTLLRDEVGHLRSALQSKNDEVRYLRKVATLKNEVSPKMIKSKIEEVFGQDNSIAHLIMSQFKRYEYSKAGVQRYSPYEKALTLTIYYSSGRKGYE